MKKPRVLVVQTGGTFAMVKRTSRESPDSGTLALTDEPIDLVREVPALASIAEIESSPLFQLDSADMQPSHWVELARATHAALQREELAGVVVVHGTDTMSYTASALAFLLGPLPKPVVLTGAQRPLSDVRTDARSNLVDAVLAATLPVPEVTVAFGARVLRGCRTVKSDAWAFDAFRSPGLPPLVELGLGVSVAPHVRAAGRLGALDARLESRVLAVRVFPGMAPRLLRGALRVGVRGLVLEAYGTGNLPYLDDASLIPVLEEAAARSIPVLIVSQCERGHVELRRYEGGAAAAEAGAISGGDMTVEAAVAKLMVALGRSSRLEDVRRYLLADVAGERVAAP
jgi:L-asparaginase